MAPEIDVASINSTSHWRDQLDGDSVDRRDFLAAPTRLGNRAKLAVTSVAGRAGT
jgi:hypothetical protein